jgi:hypothetical protein
MTNIEDALQFRVERILVVEIVIYPIERMPRWCVEIAFTIRHGGIFRLNPQAKKPVRHGLSAACVPRYFAEDPKPSGSDLPPDTLPTIRKTG